MSLARHHPEFESNGCVATYPVSTITHTKEQRAKCIYQLTDQRMTGISLQAQGFTVYQDYAPPFCATDMHVFASTFGIEFTAEEGIYVRPISAYEHASCLRLDRDLTFVCRALRTFACLIVGSSNPRPSCSWELYLTTWMLSM